MTSAELRDIARTVRRGPVVEDVWFAYGPRPRYHPLVETWLSVRWRILFLVKEVRRVSTS
ncbi:hypothetical protein ACFXDJ_06660 [Streptomyces sp. NPDC059443]|uniref:hypothetical protein n=1 Tax=unclassified Streptomyces TaxID=2593676 RepID=UPI0036A6B8EF